MWHINISLLNIVQFVLLFNPYWQTAIKNNSLFYLEAYKLMGSRTGLKLFMLICGRWLVAVYRSFIKIKQQDNKMELPTHEEAPAPATHLIGLRSEKLMGNSYNIQHVMHTKHWQLIINHGQQLILYNEQTKQLYPQVSSHHQQHKYIKATFSQKQKIIFLLTQQQNLCIFSYDIANQLINLNSNTVISLKELRYCLAFIYMDEYNAFLVLEATGLKIVYVEIVSNHLRSLFRNAYLFKIKEVGLKKLGPIYSLQYASEMRRVGDYVLLYNSEHVKIIWHKNDKIFNEKQSVAQTQAQLVMKGILKLGGGKLPHEKYSRRTVIQLKSVCSPPQQLTTILYNPQLCLLICGTNMGNLKVYKINTKNIIATSPPNTVSQIEVEAKTQLLFMLNLHNTKPIIALQMYSQKIILTVGLDEYLEVISFDQMAAIQKFKCESGLSCVNFVNSKGFVAVRTVGFEQFLGLFQVSIEHQMLMQHNSEVQHAIYNQQTGILVLSDNSVNILEIRRKQQKNKQVHKPKQSLSPPKQPLSPPKVVTSSKPLPVPLAQVPSSSLSSPKQSFIPSNCKSILCVCSHPQNKNQFWLLTDKSQIYKYTFTSASNSDPNTKGSTKGNNPNSSPATQKHPHFSIVDIVELQHFEDQYRHETKQKICVMKFIDILPIYYDSDIKQKQYYPNHDSVEQKMPILFGCQTGEIIVCSALTPTNIISRFRCFSDPVLSIAYCRQPDSEPLTQDQLGDSVIFGKDRDEGFHPHRIRTIVYSSVSELICLKISNYKIPQISFKLHIGRLATPILSIHQVCEEMAAILHNNIPKLLFTTGVSVGKANAVTSVQTALSNSGAYQLRLWMPNKIIHQAVITCMQYSQGGFIASGDQLGKIVLWNLFEEVLLIVKVSQIVRIDLVYSSHNLLCFGYLGKIFELDLIAYMKEQPHHNLQQLLSNSEFQSQFTISVNSETPSKILSLIFPAQPHQSPSHSLPNHLLHTPSRELPSSSAQLQRTLSNEKSEEIDRYVYQIRKELVKMEKQAESLAVDRDFGEQLYSHQGDYQPKSKSKHNSKKIKNSRSHSLHKAQPQQQQAQNPRITRAKTILHQFKTPSSMLTSPLPSPSGLPSSTPAPSVKEFSLPQINLKKNAQFSTTFLKNEPQQDADEMVSRELKQKKKKNRNKKYEFLFHFPNEGLYTQLISKNMIQ